MFFKIRFMSFINFYKAIFLIYFLCMSCTVNKQDYKFFALSGLLSTLPDFWARLYWIHPFISLESKIDFITITQQEWIDSNKKKIILISGWNYNDKSDRNYPSEMELKERVLKNWKHLFSSFHFGILANHYEIFVFDYLSSEPVDQNGWRLRRFLDDIFSGQNENVVILPIQWED